MSWEISCADMCRACMKIGGVLLSMYDDETIRRKNLPDKLAELASIQIDRFDGLPNMLCAKCAYRTDAFYDFKLQVQATERKLRKMFETQVRSVVKEELTVGEHEQQDWTPRKGKATLECSSDHTTDIVSEMWPVKEEAEQTLEIDISELVGQANGNIERQPNVRTRNILISSKLPAELTGIQKELKSGIPEEITKILESQNLDYTIMYIPEEEVKEEEDAEADEADVEEGTEEELIESVEQEGETSEEKGTADEEKKLLDTSDELSNAREIEEASVNPASLQDSEERRQPVATAGAAIARQTGLFCEKRWERARSREEEANEPAEEETDGSDSDYFVDPKDNILGSLNDTITRIKEVRLEGDAVGYQCTLCLQNYEKLTGVLLHTIDNHVPSTGPFFCVVCEKDCESHRELRAHVKTHTGQFPYICFICKKAYAMKRYLKRHMVCHTDFPRHRCPKCGLRFKAKSELESHVATHIRGAPYACSQCPRLFNHKGNYKRHLITHLDPQGLHLPKYPCNVCGKRFLNNRTLETHMRVHTGEKPFKCEVCGRSFSQQGNLLNHARIHSNPRSYTCEVCGKRFNQRATLRDHSLLHTGEKPYVCNVCGIAFTFSAALRRHMWTHTGGKPFGCEVCSARFVGKYDLRRHMRVHTDRPRPKRRRNQPAPSAPGPAALPDDSKEEEETAGEDRARARARGRGRGRSRAGDNETVFIEQVLLGQDAATQQLVRQQDSEKENVDALFNLIQYG